MCGDARLGRVTGSLYSIYPHENTHDQYRSGDLEVGAKEGKHLCIPLGLFFTAHPSKYFPIAAIAAAATTSA